MGIRLATLLSFFATVLFIWPQPVSAQRASRDSTRVERSTRARGSARGDVSSSGRSEAGERARSSTRSRAQTGSRERSQVEVRDRSQSRAGRSRVDQNDNDRDRTRVQSNRRENVRGRSNERSDDDRRERYRDDRNRRESDDRNRRYGDRDWRDGDDRDRHYGDRDWQYENDRHAPVYVPHRARVHPFIHVDIAWPWVHRRERRWSPLYRYRQVVDIDAGWGRGHRHSRMDVRTFYRHRIRSASSARADVDVYIERIEIYDDGYFVGEVRHIPNDLARVRATMYRRGGIQFDRDVFIVGDPYAGFELVSTRHYGGFVLDHYRRAHGYRAGALDFRRERIVPVRHSRLFDPYDFGGFVPIGLLPQDDAWFGDYGSRSPSRHWYGEDDVYFYGVPDASYGYDDRSGYERMAPRGATNVHSGRVLPEVQPLQRSDDQTYRTNRGAEIRVQRETSLRRIE